MFFSSVARGGEMEKTVLIKTHADTRWGHDEVTLHVLNPHSQPVHVNKCSRECKEQTAAGRFVL